MSNIETKIKEAADGYARGYVSAVELLGKITDIMGDVIVDGTADDRIELAMWFCKVTR